MAEAGDRLAQVFVWKEGSAPDLAYARQLLSVINPEAYRAIQGDSVPVQLISVIGRWPDEPWARALADMRAIPAPAGSTWTDTTRYDLAGWQGVDQRTGDHIFVVMAYNRAAAVNSFSGGAIGAPPQPAPAVPQVPFYPQFPTGPITWPPPGQPFAVVPYAQPQLPQGYVYGYAPVVTAPITQVPGAVPAQVSGPAYAAPEVPMSYEPFYAGFGPRLAAALIDLLLVALFQLLTVLALIAWPVANVETAWDWIRAYSPFACLALAIAVNYHVLQWTVWGQTLGKKLMRLRVVTAEGDYPDLGRSLLRAVGYVFSLAIAGWGFLMIALDPRRQGLHDKVAETYVVPEKPPALVPVGLPGYKTAPATAQVEAAQPPPTTATPRALTSGTGDSPAVGMAAVAGEQPYGVANINRVADAPAGRQDAAAEQAGSGAVGRARGNSANVDTQAGSAGTEASLGRTSPERGAATSRERSAPDEYNGAGGNTTLPNLGEIPSGPVTDILQSQSLARSDLSPSHERARELFKSGLAQMEMGVRSSLQGYKVEPTAARRAAEIFNEALELVPNSITYRYFYAVALRYAEGFELAVSHYRQVVERDPSHYEARQQIAYGPRWHDAFAYPLWQSPPPVERDQMLPDAISVLLPLGQQPGTRLVLLREGANKIVAALSRTPRRAWAVPPTADMPARIEAFLSNTPYGPIIALYAIVQDDPQNPYIGETFLNAHDAGQPADDACQMGQHMLEQLARQDHTYLIFADENNNLLLSRRLVFDANTQVMIARVLYEVQNLPPQIMDPERFRQAAQWHMEHFSLDQVKGS